MLFIRKLYYYGYMLIGGFLLAIQTANAWQSHFLLTYPILKTLPEISQEANVPAETLTAFLTAESENLVFLLKNMDAWPGQTAAFPSLPLELIFNGKQDTKRSLLQQFTDRARIHPQEEGPGVQYDTLFVEYAPQEVHRIHNPLCLESVVLASIVSEIPLVNPPLEKVNPGELVSPLEIIASAVDEPDFGMDIDLWEDNGTPFGKRYKLGNTPNFTNKEIAIGTQAPFHMGFYNEPYSMMYVGLPSIKNTYPEYRIHFFITLSKYAFKTGHLYWGYRFLGWAMHYLQDLDQPYHAKLAPGYNAGYLMLVHVFDGAKENKIKNTITNKHLALENYQFNLMKTILAENNNQNRFILALTDNSQEYKTGYNDLYPRNVVAKEAYDQANALNDALTKALSKIVNEIAKSDDGFSENANLLNFGSANVDLYSKVDQNDTSVKDFNDKLVERFKKIGAHTRALIWYAMH